ncbi:MAG: hypothetical protein AAF749_13930, partial [Pseudomonadota bacterium]
MILSRKPLNLLLVTLAPCLMLVGVGTGYIFDDTASLSPLLQLRQDTAAFWPLVFDGAAGPLGRPLSLVTFAIEQRFFSATPDFSQVVSIAVHCCNGLLVYAILLLVLRSYGDDDRYFWAVLGALLWVCAPQKVSTVLYIVQRMTMLSAFFTLVALWAYLKGRTTVSIPKSWLYFALCLIALFLAPFAKENGVLAVPIIASAELLLLGGIQSEFYSKRLILIALTILLGGAAAFFALGVLEWNHSFDSYSRRNFDFWDRVVAIPTILSDYIRQFFLPDTRSMGLLHDDWLLLGSGLSPLIFSLSVCVLLAVAVVPILAYKIPRLGVAGFGCSIFLIGHSIESSFLPLELYFEHRNYLPSLGLVVVATEIARAVHTRFLANAAKVFRAFVIGYLLLCTVSSTLLATWWRTPGMLMQHHFAGHPN